MRRYLIIAVLLFLSVNLFAQNIRRDTLTARYKLRADDKFIWQGLEIYRDSIVYAEWDADSIRFKRVDGSWTSWYKSNYSHTGDVSGSTVLTIGDDKVTESMLKAVNAPTDEYVLTYEETTGDFEWQVGAGGSGEVNTASSQGTGTSIYYTKSGVDLQFNAIKSENSLLSVALDGVTHDVELTINESLINHNNLTNYSIDQHRTINDAGSATTDLWSADKITTMLAGKEPTLTKGNLTESTSSILTITGGTGSVIGSGTSIQVQQATTSTNGYLSSTDWNTFNNKVSNATHTGDVSGSTTLTIGADKILESHLKAVNAPTDEYVLTYEATTGDFEWQAGGGSGEINTASSQGTGTSIYYTKSGVDLQFNAIKSENSLLSIALDGITHDVELTLNESLINHNNLTNYSINQHRTINDAGSATTDLWSADKITTMLSGKEPTLTKGNLTESTSSVLSITGGTGSVIGSGTTIQVQQATTSTPGYLSSTDWNTFNNKVSNATHTGDVTGSTVLTIGADKVLESHLKAVNEPTDEYALTYEATTGDFEWQAMAGGSFSGSVATSYVPYASSNDVLASSIIRANTSSVGIGSSPQTGMKLYINQLDNTGDASNNSYGARILVNGYPQGLNYGLYIAVADGVLGGYGLYNQSGDAYFGDQVIFNSVPALGTASTQVLVRNTTTGIASYRSPAEIVSDAGFTAHNPVTLGTANGLTLSTQVLSLGLASSTTTGALSSTNWNTFNNKVSNATHSGDVSGSTTLTIGSDKILESHLKAVNAPTDEYALTYEATTGDFEWQAMSAGGGTPGGTTGQLQYNNAGSFGGTSSFTFDGTSTIAASDAGAITWGTDNDLKMFYATGNDAIIFEGNTGFDLLRICDGQTYVMLPDNVELMFGDSQDLQIDYNSTLDAIVFYSSTPGEMLHILPTSGAVEIQDGIDLSFGDDADFQISTSTGSSLSVYNNSSTNIFNLSNTGAAWFNGALSCEAWIGTSGGTTAPTNLSQIFQIYFNTTTKGMFYLDDVGTSHELVTVSPTAPAPRPGPQPPDTFVDVDTKGISSQMKTIEFSPDKKNFRSSTLYFENGILIQIKPEPWQRLGLIRKLFLKP